MQSYFYKETLLKVSNVSKLYSTSSGYKQVLRDINFEVKDVVCPGRIQGQVIGLVGQSGGGKTTLLNLLAGVDQPTKGEITAGIPLKPIVIGEMGVVYQNYYLYEWEKVQSILEMAVEKNPAVKDKKQQIESIANDFNISEHLKKYPAQLSGGQKQRVAVAEQILCGNEFILLDEPFSGLDVMMIDKVIDFLVKVSLTDELKTLIIVSHDLYSTCAIADTVMILAKEKEKEGSTIVKQINMMDRGLAWRKDVKDDPMFNQTIKEIKSLL